MAKKVVNPVHQLEKALDKLQLKLISARQRKVALLEKSTISHKSKLEKAKQKQQLLKRKKLTAANTKQLVTVKKTIADLKENITDLKRSLTSEKILLDKATLLRKTAEKAAQEIKQAKLGKKISEKKEDKKSSKVANKKNTKKVIRKKAVKKVIRKSEPLTPDLSLPVEGIEKHPKTAKKKWKPKTKVEKNTDDTTEQISLLKEDIHQTPEKKIDPMLVDKIINTTVNEKTSETRTELEPGQEPQPMQTKETEKQPEKEENKQISINWHIMPLIKPNSDG